MHLDDMDGELEEFYHILDLDEYYFFKDEKEGEGLNENICGDFLYILNLKLTDKRFAG